MRAWSVIQEGRVKGRMVSSLLSFAAFVFAPKCLGCVDIPLLSLFGATAQEDDQHIAFPAKVDPIARAEVYSIFKDSPTYTLGIGKIALPHPEQCF